MKPIKDQLENQLEHDKHVSNKFICKSTVMDLRLKIMNRIYDKISRQSNQITSGIMNEIPKKKATK